MVATRKRLRILEPAAYRAPDRRHDIPAKLQPEPWYFAWLHVRDIMLRLFWDYSLVAPAPVPEDEYGSDVRGKRRKRTKEKVEVKPYAECKQEYSQRYQANFKFYLTAENLTSADIAEKIGSPPWTVTRLISKIGLPDLVIHTNICKVLDISMDDFLKPHEEFRAYYNARKRK